MLGAVENVSELLSDAMTSQSLQPHHIAGVITSYQLLMLVVVTLLGIVIQDAVRKRPPIAVESWRTWSTSTSLPGPPWWTNFPLLGYLPWLGSKPYVVLWELSRRYGNVYRLKFGGRDVVVLNGLETIRTAFVRNGDAFAGRPNFPSFAAFCKGNSLAFGTFNSQWTAHRKAAIRALGAFTNNTKYPIEALIHHHAVQLADQLLRNSDSATEFGVDPYDAIEHSVVDVIFEMCFGQPYDNDAELHGQMLKQLHDMREVMPAVQSADVMQWTAPLVRRQLMSYTKCLDCFDHLVSNKVNTIAAEAVPDEPTCIAQALNMVSLAEKDTGSYLVDHHRLMSIIQDLIGAGSEGVVHFIHWAILYATLYVDKIQAGVRSEIGRTIGQTGVVTASDRSRMPYTEACIWEIARHCCLAPMSIPHAAVRDTMISGRRVASGTVVFANFYSTGWDTEVWGDPAEFRPERFLTADGEQLDREAVDKFVCFGVGKRRCLGAQLGRLEMFLFFVVLMQRCEFKPPIGSQLSTDGQFVLTNRAKNYRVHITPPSAAAFNDNVEP